MLLKKKIGGVKRLETTPNTREKQSLTPNNDIGEVVHQPHNSESMRGLLYIAKGQYKKSGKSFLNTASGDVSYIGGYDPEVAEEWYMLRDRETHHCLSCGRDLDKILSVAKNTIKRFKGSTKRYLKFLSDTTSDDTYDVRYLGMTPISKEERARKSEKGSPRVSPVDRCLFDCVYQEYGMYFQREVEKVEDEVFDFLNTRPKNTLKRKVKKLKVEME